MKHPPTGENGVPTREREVRPKTADNGNWVLFKRGDEPGDLPPVPWEQSALEDLAMLERIADFLAERFPETRGMDVDEAVFRVAGGRSSQPGTALEAPSPAEPPRGEDGSNRLDPVARSILTDPLDRDQEALRASGEGAVDAVRSFFGLLDPLKRNGRS